jgi:exopolysaccharide biosynthesis WecB/TagA/CpsF family protein
MRPPALLFGIPIDDVTMDESLDRIGELIVAGRTHARTHQVATVNVDFLVNSLASEELADILRRADLNLADGMPVVWGARRSGAPLRERVTGADLVPAMAARAAITGWHIHLFGSAPGVAEAAAERLLQQHPQARITADSGPMIPDVTKTPEDVLAQIAAVDADVLCLALGNPKQERFIVANRDRLRTPVMIGIGGTLDMIVGDKKRAPMWAQRVGLEWVFRALQEPRRLGKRYAHDARVFFPKIRAYLRSLPDSQTTWHVHPDLVGDSLRITASAASANSSAWDHVGSLLDQVRVVEIDLSGAPSLDLADWRTIVGVMRTTYHNAETAITGVGDSLAKQLAQLSLAHTVHGLATSLPNNER